jgi:hypothetical protein
MHRYRQTLLLVTPEKGVNNNAICINANLYDFSVIVTNFGPKLRCYGQQSTKKSG